MAGAWLVRHSLGIEECSSSARRTLFTTYARNNFRRKLQLRDTNETQTHACHRKHEHLPPCWFKPPARTQHLLTSRHALVLRAMHCRANYDDETISTDRAHSLDAAGVLTIGGICESRFACLNDDDDDLRRSPAKEEVIRETSVMARSRSEMIDDSTGVRTSERDRRRVKL